MAELGGCATQASPRTSTAPPKAPPRSASSTTAAKACGTATRSRTACSGASAWASPECTPGDTEDCGLCGPDEEECKLAGLEAQCRRIDGIPQMDYDDCNTPLVLSFESAPVQLRATPRATFDINDAGGCIWTDWPTAVTPWLALDLDRSGSIETGRELFGSGTRLASGGRARNGFMALAQLDDNGDGRIDALDSRFAELVLWGDKDSDKLATLAELQHVAVRGILSIELDYTHDRHCDDRGNCEVERAAFTYIARGGEVRQGEVVDIHLSCQ